MATATLQVPPATYELDRVHSTVGFTVKHMVVSRFRGSFSDFDASLQIDEHGQPALTGYVRVASVDAKDPNLAAHLQSPEFFDGERHPEITFRSTSTRVSDDGEIVLDGELTIKGNTRPIEARGVINYIEADVAGGARVGVDLETVIDRTAYGLNWNAPLPKGGFAVDNDVRLAVELEFAATAPQA
jgi:polyisoprenoid-binding protein YceI